MSILSDELALPAYAGMTDKQRRVALNSRGIERIRLQINGSDLFKSQNNAEYVALTDAKKAQWLALCSMQSFKPNSKIVAIVKDIYGNASLTLASFNVDRRENISKTTELGISRVRMGDIQEARTI